MSELLGLPYVGWSPRPLKNGQPPACTGQCNLNIGARKVGNALKRLPNIQLGDKVKEEILQKWDPATRSMVTIHTYKPAILTSSSFVINSTVITVSWSLYKANATTNDDVNVQLFQLSMLGGGATTLFAKVNSTTGGCTFNVVPGFSYYAVITPTAGMSTITPTLYLNPFISATMRKTYPTTLVANWTVLTPVGVSLQLQKDTNGDGIFVNNSSAIIGENTTTYSQAGFNFVGNTQFRFILNVISPGMFGTITSNTINP